MMRAGTAAARGSRSRVRIVYVVDNVAFRGGERTFLQLVQGLPRGRYETAVACSPGGVLMERLHDMGVPVIAAEMRRRRRIDTVLSLARELRARQPHIVHTQGRGDPFGRLAARLARVPALVSTMAAVSSRYDVDELWRKALYRLIDLTTDRLVDRYIVVNSASVEVLIHRHRIPPARIAVIPNGIEPALYDPGRQAAGAWRQRLRVPAGAALIGAAGRLAPEKGFGDLIRAFASLDGGGAYLAIAGDGPELDELLELARGLGVGERVIMPGFVSDIPGFLRDLDLFVLSSRQEGHPMALLEAMAMQRPVIATDIPGVADTIAEGVDGRLVPAGDVAALAAMMARLIEERDEARRLGKQARRKILGEYTVENMVRRTGVLYEELLADKGLSV